MEALYDVRDAACAHVRSHSSPAPHLIENEETRALAVLCDFVAGDGLALIARRYGVDLAQAEEEVRRGLVRYGFSNAAGAAAAPPQTSKAAR